MKKLLSVVLSTLLVSLPVQADRLFTVGFEENNLVETMWTAENLSGSGAVDIVTTPVHAGTYALRCQSISGGGAAAARRHLDPAFSGTEAWTRFYFQWNLRGSTDTEILLVENSGAVDLYRIRLRTSGSGSAVLILSNLVGTGTDTGTVALTVDTWYRVEFRVLLSDTVGELEVNLYLGDSTTASDTLSVTGEDTLNSNIQRFDYGNTSDFSSDYKFFYDDIAINDDGGTFEVSAPGPGKVFLLVPSGDNTITWDRIPTDTTNWDRVDDLSSGAPDDSTTYIHTTTNETDKLDMANLGAEVPSDADIILLDVYGRQGSDGTTGTRVIDFELWDEADSQTTLLDVNADLSGWTICDTDGHLVFDAGSRSKANIDSFRLGYSRSIGGANEIRITAQWVNVEWIEAAAAPAFRPKVIVY
jgi:hypothetical protein